VFTTKLVFGRKLIGDKIEPLFRSYGFTLSLTHLGKRL